jgi:hypothetical protein
VLGHPSPAFTVIVALLAGTTSLMTHTAKATTRLVSHASPEPFSNIALSLGEDVAVLGGLALIHYNPLLALAVFAAALAVFLYFASKILRAMKVKVWLALKKLNGPAGPNGVTNLPQSLSGGLAPIFDRSNVLHETIAWAVSCVSGRGRGIPSNLFGALVATREEPRKISFVARKSGRSVSKVIELEGATVAHEPKFLSDNLTISGPAGKYSFIFPRSEAGVVIKLVQDLRVRVSAPIWPVDASAHLEPAVATQV